MTEPQKIRRITALEERLLAAHDALSAVLDDEEALLEVTVDAFDLNEPGRKRSIAPEIKSTKDVVEWALRTTRKQLARLGALERR